MSKYNLKKLNYRDIQQINSRNKIWLQTENIKKNQSAVNCNGSLVIVLWITHVWYSYDTREDCTDEVL